MTVTRERFDQGLTWEQYLETFKVPRAPWEANYANHEFDQDDLAFFRSLPGLFILTTSEDWCGDARNYVPIVARLAAECPNVTNRIFIRDQNLDIVDQYLKDGEHRSIPVFVLFDQDFNELGHFIERPAEVSAWSEQKRQEWAAANPDFAEVASKPMGEWSQESRQAYIQASCQWSAENYTSWANLTVRKLREIAEKAATPAR